MRAGVTRGRTHTARACRAQVGTLRSTSDGPISNRGAGLAKRSGHARALPWRSFFVAKPVRAARRPVVGADPVRVRRAVHVADPSARQVLAVYAAHFTHNWSWYLLLSWLPVYLSDQGADLAEVGVLAMLPQLLAFALANLGAALADRVLLGRCGWSLLTVRRLMGALSQLGPAAAMGALVVVRGRVSGSVLTCVAIGMGSLAQSGFMANILDIAPRHAGIVLGISNTMATLPGILCNISTGMMLDAGLGWAPVFAIGAALELAGALAFVSYARGTPQFV